MRTQKSRIWELDFFRGLSILLVVVDHAMVDFALVYSFWESGNSQFLTWLYTIANQYLTSDIRALWRPAFVFIFFFTSGLCTAFSRNNFLRGCKLACAAAFVSIVTYYTDVLFDTEVYAMFGVLHCLATVILFYSLVELVIKGITFLSTKIAKRTYGKRWERIIHIALCLGLGIAFCIVHKKLNVSLLEVDLNYATVDTDSKILGLFFYCDNWWTADYFPLFPFIAFFFLGAGCARIFYEKRRSLLPDLDGVWHVPFTFAGRHSLLFYLGGQAVVIALCMIASQIVYGQIF